MKQIQKAAPPPVPAKTDDPWEEVKDPKTGGIYWWNTETDETTAIGLLQQIHPTHFFEISYLIHFNFGRRPETVGPAAAAAAAACNRRNVWRFKPLTLKR